MSRDLQTRFWLDTTTAAQLSLPSLRNWEIKMDIFWAQTAAKLKNILQNIDQSEYLLPKHDKFKFYLKQLLAKSILTRCFNLVPVLDTLYYCIKCCKFFFVSRFMYFSGGRGLYL